MNAGGGSIGMIGAARAGLLCAPDRSDATGMRKVLSPVKNNLGKLGGSQAFHIEDVEGIGRIVWDGACDDTAESLLREPEIAREKPRDRAREFLLRKLADGRIAVSELLSVAEDEGISEKTLRKAAKDAGVQNHRAGFGPGSQVFWELPDDA